MWIPDRQRIFTRIRTIRKSSYNQKIWIFIIRKWVEKANLHWKKKQYHGLEKIYEYDKKNYSKNLANKTKNGKTTDFVTADLI